MWLRDVSRSGGLKGVSEMFSGSYTLCAVLKDRDAMAATHHMIRLWSVDGTEKGTEFQVPCMEW